MRLEPKSLVAGLLVGTVAAFSVGQRFSEPRDVAGRYQLVAADNRLWMFDTANMNLWNIRTTPQGDDVDFVDVPMVRNATRKVPMIGPVLPDGMKASKPSITDMQLR